eukprot:COSAG06_NODE_1351_length_9765_cov_3.151976_3_plen_164_part_00
MAVTTPLLLHALQNNAGQPLVSFPYTVADSLGAEATAQKQRRCVAIVPRSRFDANRSFAQTGSNKGKRKRRFVCTGTAGNELNFHSWFDPTGAKRHFLCHSYIKCIVLPRQARDKHRESTQKKSGVSHSGGTPRTGRWRRHRLCQPRRTGTKTHLYASCVCSK